MFTRTITPGNSVDLHYITLDDVVSLRMSDRAPLSPSATGYGHAIPTRCELRCAVGDDERLVWRRVYVVRYGNSGTPYVRGTVDGERQDYVLDTMTAHFMEDNRSTGVHHVTLDDIVAARDLDERNGGHDGYVERLMRSGAPRGLLRTHDTDRADDVGSLTRACRLYFAQYHNGEQAEYNTAD